MTDWAAIINPIVSQTGALGILAWLTIYTFKVLIPRLMDTFSTQLEATHRIHESEMNKQALTFQEQNTALIHEIVLMRQACVDQAIVLKEIADRLRERKVLKI